MPTDREHWACANCEVNNDIHRVYCGNCGYRSTDTVHVAPVVTGPGEGYREGHTPNLSAGILAISSLVAAGLLLVGVIVWGFFYPTHAIAGIFGAATVWACRK